MTDSIDKYSQLWEEITRLVTSNSDVQRSIAGQLRLATVKGGGGGLLYLAVEQEFTQKLLENNLRQPILEAMQQLSEPSDISDFVVLVETTAPQQPRRFGYNSPANAGQAPAAPNYQQQHNTQPHQTVGTQPLATPAPAHLASAASATPPITTAPAETVISGVPGAVTAQSDRVLPKPLAPHGNTTGLQSINPTTMLNPHLTFENFVIGQTNRMAQAASIAVAEAPGVAYRPLFIYGESGLGKTHLLHAIGNAALGFHPGIRVRYVSSEEFTNSFINAIKNNKGAEFHESWRQVDILLIDDIQFLSRAKETLEAFFHTFNTLQNQNKQIVITSDVAPKQLVDIENRLISRFEQGLLTDIQAPERDTRIAILKMKAEREGLDLAKDALEFIADNFTANIRSLEGALTKVIAYSSLNGQEITYDLVYTLLKNQLPSDADIEIQPQKIIAQTAEFFNVTVEEIYGPKRTQQLTKPRHIAMYLCHEMTSLSLPKIGDLFNGRDHTTVMHACKKIRSAMGNDHILYNEIEELTQKIRNENRK